MPKPLEYFEKFYKLSPYVIPVITGLGKGTETMTGIGGWLSGEDYTGNNTYSTRMTGADKREVGYRGFGSPYRESPTGAFGGFENTARNFFTGHGYSQLGNLAGDTINLLGEIASTPFELGLQAQDLGRGFLSNLKEHTPDWLQRNVSGLAGAYMQLQEDKRNIFVIKPKFVGIVIDEMERVMKDITSFLKKEYKSVTGNTLSLTASGEIDILVQSTSNVRSFVNAVKYYKIGGVDSTAEEERTIDAKFKKFLDQGGWKKASSNGKD